MSGEKNEYTVIPAQPGWAVVEAGEEEVWEEPIIAWQIVSEPSDSTLGPLVYPLPITVEGLESAANTAILRPDGKVVVAHSVTYDSKEQFLKSYQDRAKRKTA